MNIIVECKYIVKNFQDKEFCLNEINNERLQYKQPPYTTNEMLFIISYLQKNYFLSRRYIKKVTRIETIFLIREKKRR